jgi:tripartite-type tricarboxylate transporter receptor subunit TctC
MKAISSSAVAFTLAAPLALFSAPAALGQTAAAYPNRPITLVVPFSPGTGIDIIARAIQPKLNQKWGQPVVVDNRPGASGNIGAEIVAKAPPNGYTLMVTVNTITITPSLYRNMPYDVLTDFTPVSKTALASYAFSVHPVVPAKTFGEFVKLVKARPGELFYSSPGNGTPHHLGMELMKLRLGLKITHVPYKGLAEALRDVVGGHVQMIFMPVHTTLPQSRSGKLRILAVSGPKRTELALEAPTFREQGMDFMDDVDAWYAVMGPAKLPADIVAKLNQEIKTILAMPDVREHLLKQGLVPVTSTPEELHTLIKTDFARWAKVVADAGIKAD